MLEYQLVSALRTGAVDVAPFEISGLELEEQAPDRRIDARFLLAWQGLTLPFILEARGNSTPQVLESTISRMQQARSVYPESYPFLIVPYLSERAIARLLEAGVSGADLCGNLIVNVPGQWLVQRSGAPNRFPSSRPIKSIYQGKSSLVGRLLLSRPRFDRIGDVRDEIERRGESISIATVSKVLSALEEELIVEKTEGVRLIQPDRLLDELVANYELPGILGRRLGKIEEPEARLRTIRAQVEKVGGRIVGRREDLYTIAPSSGTPLRIYLSARDSLLPNDPVNDNSLSVPLSEIEWTDRFANVECVETDDPTPFFDAIERNSFPWCSKLQIYLELMQGGDREKGAAAQLRKEIVDVGTIAREG